MMGSVATARRDADALLAIVDCGRSPEATMEELQLTAPTKASLPTAVVSRSAEAHVTAAGPRIVAAYMLAAFHARAPSAELCRC